MLARRTILAAAGLAALAVLAPRRSVAGRLVAHDFAFAGITGGSLRLADYAGKPVLVVNTASRCGYTGQYAGLQTLWERYRDRGLVVLGVPSDDFNQELESEAEVKRFCEANYAIDFPMTAITPVKGRSAHPFYVWAAERAGPVRWNFHKYLIGPDGAMVAAFPTRTEPTATAVTAEIERLLPGG